MVLSALAVIGGPTGAILCLHEFGEFHCSSLSGAEHGPATIREGSEGPACHTGSFDNCNGCIDVEIKGLNLAEVRPEDGEALFIAASSVIRSISIQEWASPASSSFSLPLSRAPPALPQVLIVLRTTVLLI